MPFLFVNMFFLNQAPEQGFSDTPWESTDSGKAVKQYYLFSLHSHSKTDAVESNKNKSLEYYTRLHI